MKQNELYSNLVKSVSKLGYLIKEAEADLPKNIQYLENGAVIVTIFKGKKTISRALFEDGIFAEGYARCNPEDVYNRKIGLEVSRARAYMNWSVKKEQVWIGRTKPLLPVTFGKEKYAIAYGTKNRIN